MADSHPESSSSQIPRFDSLSVSDAGDLPPRRKVPSVPDLRFETVFARTVQPYVHLERPATSTLLIEKSKPGAAVQHSQEVVRVDWGAVVIVTIRDHVLSPFLQGMIWGVVSHHLRPTLRVLRQGFLGWWRRGESHLQRVRTTDGDGVGWLRGWISSLTAVNTRSGTSPSRHSI